MLLDFQAIGSQSSRLWMFTSRLLRIRWLSRSRCCTTTRPLIWTATPHSSTSRSSASPALTRATLPPRWPSPLDRLLRPGAKTLDRPADPPSLPRNKVMATSSTVSLCKIFCQFIQYERIQYTRLASGVNSNCGHVWTPL